MTLKRGSGNFVHFQKQDGLNFFTMSFVLLPSAVEVEKLLKTKWAQFFETPCIKNI
jgi:hypothetical protein